MILNKKKPAAVPPLIVSFLVLVETSCTPVCDTTISHVNTPQGSTPMSMRQEDLVACLGLPLEQVEATLTVIGIEPEKIREPPTQLRGLSFDLPQDSSLMLFLDQDDATLAAQNKALKWDISVLGKVSVIGLRYETKEEVRTAGEIPVSIRLHDVIQDKGAERRPRDSDKAGPTK